MVRLLTRTAVIAAALLICGVAVGRWLPAEGQIAFQSNLRGDQDIFLVDVRTAALVNLTRTHTGNQTSPAWSPDGNQLVFEYANLGTRAVSGIDTMHADGTHTHRIFRGTATQPTWSPEGRYITFTTSQALYLANAEGGGARVVQEGETLDYSAYLLRQNLVNKQPDLMPNQSGTIVDAQWSADRNSISFTFFDGDSTQGYRLDPRCAAECADAAALIPNTREARGVALSTDAQRAAFECKVGDYRGICVMDTDGHHLRQIVVSPRGVRSLSPVWRP
jgi:dipeptidyl aminopeptidase/acylaminoacyl peptidase